MLHPSHLDVWYLGDKHKYENKLSKLVTIKYSKNDYVRCSAISPDGTWIVYSTEEKLKIFSLIMVCDVFFSSNIQWGLDNPKDTVIQTGLRIILLL